MPAKKYRGKDQIKWAKYRWEFMRYNEDYRKAYQEIKILRSKTDPSPDKVIKTEHTVTYPYLNTATAKKEKELCDKFGLYSDCMINPEKSFDDLISNPNSMEGNCFCIRTFWQHWAKIESNGSRLVIDIDFSKINSLENLKVELNALLDIKYKDTYKKYLQKIYQNMDSQRRFRDEMEDILEVGRRRKDESNIDIAKDMFPSNAEGEQAAQVKVSKHYKKFKKLVSGGYKELTYP